MAFFGRNKYKDFTQRGTVTGGSTTGSGKIGHGADGGVNMYKTKDGNRAVSMGGNTFYERDPGSGHFLLSTGGSSRENYIKIKDYESQPTPAPAPAPAPSSGGGYADGGGLLNPLPQLGPYPNENIYHPILETEYTAPNAQDWSQYMPVDGLLTGGAQARYPQAIFPPLDDDGRVLAQTPSEPITGGAQFDIPGLLYQPWSTEYQQAFVPGNIWQYDPNQFGVGQVSYIDNPMGKLKLPEDWKDLLGPFEEEEEESEETTSSEK